MQLPEPPPPPLAPLWDRVLRARALPPDLDVQLLYIAIKDRLSHPEWEVRLHALRVLADLLPISGNALSFPFDQVIDNLGHNSPNVRKAALDALKVFCSHCEDPDCAARAIIDKFSYNNIRAHTSDVDIKINILTGLILSIPSLIGILKRRNSNLDMFPVFQILGEKLFDNMHKDVALRSLMKLRRLCGPRQYMICFSRLDSRIQDKFRVLCEMYDEDSQDVFYAPRKSRPPVVHINHIYNNSMINPIYLSTDSSSDDSYRVPFHNSNYAKVIIETEIKFDSDTAITMTVLEQNETESDKNTASDDDCDSSDRIMLKYSDVESEEDTDVVVKKVRFGGESVKIRTPDSDNLITSEEDANHNRPALLEKPKIEDKLTETSSIINKMQELKRENRERESNFTSRKSGIPLPIISNKGLKGVLKPNKVKMKSKSLSELYDYFNKKSDVIDGKSKENSGFALTLTEVTSPDKVPSPVELHREVEVLHNLQRSPTLSPRRQQTRLSLDNDRFILNLVASSRHDSNLLSPRPPSPLRGHYDWEELHIIPQHVAVQLHNTENWIAAVKAADYLHSKLLDPDNVQKLEPAVLSFVQHMWAISDAVSAARAPAEGAVCAVVRSGSSTCVRQLLPVLIARIARDPPPAGLPHALLQRMALHHLVELIFEPDMIRDSENGQLRAALCLARAAGPAAVLSAVRRRLSGSSRADTFCNELRERLNRPVDNMKCNQIARISQLPVPARRRARSTPPAAPPPRPRRLRPLPDSAPLPGISQPGRPDLFLKPLSSMILLDGDSSAVTASAEETEENKNKKNVEDYVIVDGSTDIGNNIEPTHHASVSRTPSIHVEDLSEKSYPSLGSAETAGEQCSVQSDNIHEEITQEREDELLPPPAIDVLPTLTTNDITQSSTTLDVLPTSTTNDITQSSTTLENIEVSEDKQPSEKSSPLINRSKSASKSLSSVRSATTSPEPTSEPLETRCERDVRTALAECMVPSRNEDWEAIVNRLIETERLAKDQGARAPAASWRAATRSVSVHVRSLRSRVARAACSTLGTLFEHRGRALDPELEEAISALLERCADVNRFLRADATTALGRVACGGGCARVGVALARRGATHRAGPVRAAAAQTLARLVRQHGAARVLELPSEPRTVMLRAAGELLADASPEARMHARHLFFALSEDTRFRQMLKEAMPPSRYRAIEKFVDKLRCR
ncbi:uncharacterized protein LOC126771227 isoform X2 [Nymphalis io]|uniref:uncharacterized protein LOC126771227 isoform X2 n=1 Tax=Inachis io TaxID=171585 RepID=UPI00216A4CDB|nr:uncharacterized protein LOC126771227 isoform X2 [Nymphalis io]